MTAKITMLPAAPLVPTANQLITRMRMLMYQHAGMRFDHPHFQNCLEARRLNMRQVLEVLKKGSPMGPSTKDESGSWRVRLRRKVAGRRVQIVVALSTDHFVVVTAT